MATGNIEFYFRRLKAAWPVGWTGDVSPVLDAVLKAEAQCFSLVHGLFDYTQIQTRLQTATGAFLDIAAFDFFGTRLVRRPEESDNLFRIRILNELLSEKVTRKGVENALFRLTGRMPVVFEPMRPADTIVYGVTGYGYARYGSMNMPFQFLVDAYRPTQNSNLNFPGYGCDGNYYGITPLVAYAELENQLQVKDADIYGAVDAVKAAGTTAWVSINN
jgi:hypothetical protein